MASAWRNTCTAKEGERQRVYGRCVRSGTRQKALAGRSSHVDDGVREGTKVKPEQLHSLTNQEIIHTYSHTTALCLRQTDPRIHTQCLLHAPA